MYCQTLCGGTGSASLDTLKQLYLSMVRPHLDLHMSGLGPSPC